ncbi:MAG: DMT family transporter [Sphingobacteriales bacterium]|nr:MAG: DMT family transporter [Sphingobacteriales bacterium]
MDKIIWVVLAFVAGAFLPLQAAMNGKLAKAGGSPYFASMISFAVGVLALVIYILMTSQTVSLKELRAAPSYAWAGGILGAFYVTVIVLAFPKIGPALTFGLVVAGQLLLSMLMEHFQIMGAQSQPMSIGRIAGILLVLAGVAMMKNF